MGTPKKVIDKICPKIVYSAQNLILLERMRMNFSGVYAEFFLEQNVKHS